MWNSVPAAASQTAGGMYGGGGNFGQSAGAPQASTSASQQQKHDIFVGNLSFNTTEEQLHQAFSEIGKVVNVRLVSDIETGKPRGFAFVEFEDPQAALSAIRNMNDYELNNRRLRVNFSNSSHLEVLAGKLGMDLTQQTQRQAATTAAPPATAAAPGATAVADALKDLSKAETYDIVAKLKEINERDPEEARRVLSSHPQLPEALLFLMSKLDMVKTPLPADMTAPVTAVVPLVRAADPRARADPRQATSVGASATTSIQGTNAAQPPRMDPRQQRVDPRQAARLATPATQARPPIYSAVSVNAGAVPPVANAAPVGTGNIAGLDPSLVQQVMSLTPQQIQQLPPDKRQSILQLRQQITGASM